MNLTDCDVTDSLFSGICIMANLTYLVSCSGIYNLLKNIFLWCLFMEFPFVSGVLKFINIFSLFLCLFQLV